MSIPILKLINLVILLVFLIGLIWYLRDLFFGADYEPASWENARKKKQLSDDLMKAEKWFGDKVRFYVFWLQVERLKRDKVAGCFAELGVYKGESARLLHLMDNDRVLHLFDTFDGLPPEDLKIETGEAATYTNRNFRDTSVEKVLSYIGAGPDKVVVHKGYFPETTVDLGNEIFALVSLDADLYNPTKAGLEFFYERLSPGGVLLIHDYNPKWEGLMRAVDEFCQTNRVVPVFIPDLQGTAMLVRPYEPV